MLSEMSDFVPGAATWRTGRNIHVVFDFGPFAPLCENMTSSAKPEARNVLHILPMGYNQRRRICLVEFARWQHWRRSCYLRLQAYYPHMPIGKVWIYRLLFLCVFVCTITDFSAEDKASGVKFCTAVHRRPMQGITNLMQGITNFGELCSHRSPKSDELVSARATLTGM